MSNLVELEAKEVVFYSDGDEAAFFEWLGKISAVDGSKGVGRVLHISVARDRVDEEALRELLALFFRFGIDMRQLSVFDSDVFATWFRSPTSYWFKAVFG
jgi:hypothetical protein